MKYRSVNESDLFEFHDADFTFDSYAHGDLTVTAQHLNIHKGNGHNDLPYDMELADAKIIFGGFRVCSFEPSRTWKRREDGELYTDDPLVIFEGKEAEEKFNEELLHGIWVKWFGREDDFRYTIEGSGLDPFFSAIVSFDTFTVEWDAYVEKAWYEQNKYHKFNVTLDTPRGAETADVTFYVTRKDVYRDGKFDVQTPDTYAYMEYGGKTLRAETEDDYIWMGSFAKLQKQLPEGVTFRCCLSCAHGNECPYGNYPNELFCTKDLTVNDKMDLVCTADREEREKRSRKYTDVCADYRPQSDDFYTYSDYPYLLKE